MNKGNILTFRLPGDLYKDLSRRAEADGSTISDLARKIIMEHARVEEVSRALEDITKKHSAEHAQLQDAIKRLADGPTTNKSTKSHGEDVDKILRLVTWLVDASPHASSKLREYGLK